MKKPKIAVPLQRLPEEKPPADMRISSHYIGSTVGLLQITARPRGRSRAFDPAGFDSQSITGHYS